MSITLVYVVTCVFVLYYFKLLSLYGIFKSCLFDMFHFLCKIVLH